MGKDICTVQDVDMDQINAELNASHNSCNVPRALIDDIPGRLLVTPFSLTERVLVHMGFLVSELEANKDLMYVEDLTDHLIQHYGVLIPNLTKLLTKAEQVGQFRKEPRFVGYVHPAVHQLCKAGYPVMFDQYTDTVVIGVGKRAFHFPIKL